ncbi:hypothetical protein J4205_03630 [Candidatus Pacearchaeota archaeon]|nr:hypothetical protein [Candidatus Pacearchaeota archaeon]
MKLRIKKANSDGIVRLESGGDIKEVMINEDFMNSKNEHISVCFKGQNSSGIIDLTPDEIEKIYGALKAKKHLIKGFKVMKFDKD